MAALRRGKEEEGKRYIEYEGEINNIRSMNVIQSHIQLGREDPCPKLTERIYSFVRELPTKIIIPIRDGDGSESNIIFEKAKTSYKTYSAREDFTQYFDPRSIFRDFTIKTSGAYSLKLEHHEVGTYQWKIRYMIDERVISTMETSDLQDFTDAVCGLARKHNWIVKFEVEIRADYEANRYEPYKPFGDPIITGLNKMVNDNFANPKVTNLYTTEVWKSIPEVVRGVAAYKDIWEFRDVKERLSPRAHKLVEKEAYKDPDLSQETNATKEEISQIPLRSVLRMRSNPEFIHKKNSSNTSR